MTTRDPNELPPPGGEPTRVFPDNQPYGVPPTTPLPSDPTRVNPVAGLPPLPPAPGYEPTQATPVPPTSTLGGPPTGTYGGGTPPPPVGGPPWARAPLPWILGGVAALLLLALLVLFVVTQSSNGGGGTPTPTVVAVTATTAPAPPTATVPGVVPPTLEPSATVPAETATPAPPSATPLAVPATVTAVPVPPTGVPPSVTPVPPPASATPVPPPATLEPPTNTPEPPAPTRTPAPETVVPATVVLPPPQGSPPPTVGTSPTPLVATPLPVTPPPAVSGSLTVQWFGQSGVLLITPDGNTILVDPPAPQTGYQLPFLGRLDALLVSRDEADYNYVAAGQTDNLLVAARNGQFIPVDAQLSDARVQAIQSQGMSGQATPNGIWVIDSPGLYMVHLGGLKGLLPQSPQLRSQPDVLFLPVGGGTVLDSAEAAQIVTQLKPRVVIPLHYKTADSRVPLAPVDDFLAAGYRDVLRPGHTWTVKPQDLKGADAVQPRIVVLDYK